MLRCRCCSALQSRLCSFRPETACWLRTVGWYRMAHMLARLVACLAAGAGAGRLRAGGQHGEHHAKLVCRAVGAEQGGMPVLVCPSAACQAMSGKRSMRRSQATKLLSQSNWYPRCLCACRYHGNERSMLIPNTIFRMGSGAWLLCCQLICDERSVNDLAVGSVAPAARAARCGLPDCSLLPATHSQLSADVQPLTHLPTCPCLPRSRHPADKQAQRGEAVQIPAGAPGARAPRRRRHRVQVSGGGVVKCDAGQEGG